MNITHAQVAKNVEALQNYMKIMELDSFYISSSDPYLNEYVPMENCHRFYFTGFDGSVAEVLVPQTGKVRLYVDGRYHEQADSSVDLNVVEVVKVPSTMSNSQNLLADIKNSSFKNIGLEADRTSLGLFKQLHSVVNPVMLNNQELHSVVEFEKMPTPNKITHVPAEYSGKTAKEKINKIINNPGVGYFITAIDSLAWVTNCRGYHLPHLSSFMGRGLLTHDKIYVFIDNNVPLDFGATDIDGVEFIQCEGIDIEKKLLELQKQYQIDVLNIDPQMLNTSDFEMLKGVFSEKALTTKAGGLVEFHSIKDDVELKIMEDAFNSGDTAIFNTLNWVKDQLKDGKTVTEKDLYNQTTVEYEKQGAVEQSFNTIAGVGPNGSIIHYGNSSEKINIGKEDMVLLDSGGYFNGGFATDTTRTFMGDSCIAPDPEYVKIYTLVLKGVLQCQNAVFKEGTKGCVLDGLARTPMMRHGYDYAHGTGHGVGIHVHESGVRLSSLSTIPMKERQVVSIEPGIYIPGFGGVRIENIAVVEKHPEFEGFLKFRSLVYIGYEQSLIDRSLLNDEEIKWLGDYEDECKKRNRSFN